MDSTTVNRVIDLLATAALTYAIGILLGALIAGGFTIWLIRKLKRDGIW